MLPTKTTATTVQITLAHHHRAQLRAIAALMGISVGELVTQWVAEASTKLGLPDLEKNDTDPVGLGGHHE